MEILLSALEQGIVPAIIVAVYLTLSDIIKSRRERHQTKISNEAMESITDIRTIVREIYDRREAENREKCKIVIDKAFDSAAFNLINFVQRTLISNHLDVNKTFILENIHDAANSEYYEILQSLSLYSVDGKRISEYLDTQWLKEIETDLRDSIYASNLTREDKLMGYVNKVTLRFRTYVNYVQTKTLK